MTNGEWFEYQSSKMLDMINGIMPIDERHFVFLYTKYDSLYSDPVGNVCDVQTGRIFKGFDILGG